MEHVLVPRKGLEPPRLAAPEPKSGASTNSAIWALPLVAGGEAHYTRTAGEISRDVRMRLIGVEEGDFGGINAQTTFIAAIQICR